MNAGVNGDILLFRYPARHAGRATLRFGLPAPKRTEPKKLNVPFFFFSFSFSFSFSFFFFFVHRRDMPGGQRFLSGCPFPGGWTHKKLNVPFSGAGL